MKLTYTFRHLDSSETLQQFTAERLLEISRFLLKGGHGTVQYSKHHHLFRVEVAINTREKFFKASAENEDIYAAVESVLNKLEKQFLKVKRTFKNHKRPELSKEGRLKRLNAQFEPAMRYKKSA